MARALRWSTLLSLLLAAPALAGSSPEVQLCLQHLKPAERERAVKQLGPLEELPLYRIQLDADPAKREVKGKVQVELTVKGRTRSELFLRVTPNASGRRVTLSEARFNGQPVALERPEPTLVRIPLEPPAEPGTVVRIEVALQATVPPGKKNAGSLLGAIGASGPAGDYGSFAASADFLSLVGVVPMMPPLNEDGQPWEGPSGIGDLALYEPSNVLGSIGVPSGWEVHATGEALGELPGKDGRSRFSFAASLVRDFPVFVSRGYQKASTTVNGVTVESVFTAQDAAVGKRVLKYTASALSEFERRLGPLPYRSFRVVEAPLSDGAGGMEFQGLITVGSSLYRGVTDPNSILAGVQGFEMFQDMLKGLSAMGGAGMDGGPFANLAKTLERTVEFTVAHEVGHQYFAGLVGSDPIQDPVADEALTQYAAVLYYEWAHGKPAAAALKAEALVSAYHLYRMSGGEDGPAHRPTEQFSSSMEYGAIVYGKAPLMFDEARKLVGEEVFQRALRTYVDTYRYKWARVDGFTRELGKAAPAHARELARLQERWWEQTHGDEDLGKPSLGALMGGVDAAQLDKETLKLLEDFLGPLSP
ncbi:M1 family aminopeptidase [Stigmatella aurantiaca]|uniref:Conserved uncharacterized protein n=1 Tax=Stigmatella aurantiaca (strain DW4/3-1) TaxID=378806 RepID=Q098P2_STIAD|nr:M1 family aminopeptidase [Stigmatella aurantiaca]ADO74148.1 conserved uncharacterized protein [Stigmatella aurantiaca DW4/3-1]EAU68219.1 hypothetical protein STIAU_7753 [Stigmatella aurantiaca DW4/3-1]